MRFACCSLSGTIAPAAAASAFSSAAAAAAAAAFDDSQGSGAMILLHNQRLSGTVPPHTLNLPVPVMALSLARNEFTGIVGPGFSSFDTV